MVNKRIPRIERSPETPRKSPEARAEGWFSRNKYLLLTLGGLLSLPILRHLGIGRQLKTSSYDGIRKAGQALDWSGEKIAQPFSYAGDRIHDAVYGKMEDPTKDNGAQRFYRGVEKFFGKDTRNLFGPTPGPEKLSIQPRVVPPKPKEGL